MEEVIDGVRYEYTRCPRLYIPESCYELVDMLSIHEDMNVPLPEYEDISPRFFQARNYLKQKTTEYQAEIMRHRNV